MDETTATADADIAQLRALAAEFGCWCEPDFMALTGWTPQTCRTYRKCREVDYVRVGHNYLYPKEPNSQRFMANSRPRRDFDAKAVL
jgi:hypothetical protein